MWITGWEIFRLVLAFMVGGIFGLVLTCCIVAGKGE